jgi:hypothetical protein
MATRLLPLSLLALVFWLIAAIQVSARSISTVGDGLLNVTYLPSTLQKRAGKEPLTWEKAVANGKGHVCNFRRPTTPPDPKTGQRKTVWTQEDLNLYWSPRVYSVGNSGISSATQDISDALKGLGISLAFPPNRGFYYQQDQEWVENGITKEVSTFHLSLIFDSAPKLTGDWHHQATWGFYISVMNPGKGMMLAENNVSPWEETRNDNQRQPPLTRWSDVNFLLWEQATRTKKELRGIKYLIRYHIVNTDTQNMINEALDSTGAILSHYPGTVFPMTSEAGQAIMGTPNGGGVAWFLVDHKNQLGVKEVESVRVFKTDGSDGKDWYHAAFNIRNTV